MIYKLVDDNIIIEAIDLNVLAPIMRQYRNQLLAESDWAMASDAPTDKDAWGAYRQALRDFPATWTPAETADFPDPPQ